MDGSYLRDDTNPRLSLLSIIYECEGYLFGEPSYDIKLDHIHDLALVLLDEIDRLQAKVDALREVVTMGEP